MKRGNLPIADNDSSANTSSRASFESFRIPERDNRSQSSNLERNNKSLIKEEVPASDETEGIINPVTSQADKTTSNRHVCVHLSNRIVDESKDKRVKCEGDEKTARAALGETSTDGDEEGCSDGTTGGDKLDLTVVETSMEMSHAIVDAKLKAGGIASDG